MKELCEVVLPDGLELTLMFDNGKLAYTFDHEGQVFGTSVKLPSRKVVDIAAACTILFTNALETKRNLLNSK